ncbi:hypothetical protein C0995_007835 [Termitomyces sp. Mi166|nr:hypothetical protein C0995_007835 [Termitomyces sp. Mi166\
MEKKKGKTEASTEMEVDQPVAILSSPASFTLVEGVIHALINELMFTTKTTIAPHPPIAEQNASKTLSGAEATVSPAIALTPKIDKNPTHIAKVMIEKNFVAALTMALSKVDFNYPNICHLVPAILKPLEHLTKLAIKMSKLTSKNKDTVDSSESSISSADKEDELDIKEEDQEKTPDLYCNSALGMYGGVSLSYFLNSNFIFKEMDDANYGGEDEMDKDGNEDEDVEMNFGK